MSDNDTGEIKREIKELRTVTDNLFEHLGELTEKVDRLGKDVAEIKGSQAKMMDSLDFIVGALQDRRQEEAAGTVWLQRHDRQIADHEGRIRTLETAER
jgi:chromosome segregation ATPase